MKQLIFFIFIALPFAGFSQKTVRLKGNTQNFSSIIVLSEITDVGELSPTPDDRIITLSKEGKFDISFEIDKPGYFRIGRNQLYLSPGDDMELYADYDDGVFAVFSGRGAAANMYLRNTPYPNAGSFIEGGDRLADTPEATLENILEDADKRSRELAALKGVSPLFKKMEAARIQADIVNSISATPDYYAYYNRIKDISNNPFINKFNAIAAPEVKKRMNTLTDTSYLNLGVFRSLLNNVIDFGKLAPAALRMMEDWQQASMLQYRIEDVSSKDSLKQFEPLIAALHTKKYRAALQQQLIAAARFGTGDEAIDFTATDENGQPVQLSSLKGKLIYLDFWATWCGPCMEEMPYYEKLKEKYKDRSDMVFVSVSIDDDSTKWANDIAKRAAAGNQWIINRNSIKEYRIDAIPRAIIINKDFKIAEMVARMPSDEGLKKQFAKLLGTE